MEVLKNPSVKFLTFNVNFLLKPLTIKIRLEVRNSLTQESELSVNWKGKIHVNVDLESEFMLEW